MNPSTNYTKLPVVTDGTECRIGGTYRTFRFVSHEAGPNHDPFASLIAQASVIDGRPKAAIPLTVTYGDSVYVDGFGVHMICRGSNSDNPLLVPSFGGRFYAHFAGFGSWDIRDRLSFGQSIKWEVRKAATDKLLLMNISTIHEARLVAALLSQQSQIDNYNRS